MAFLRKDIVRLKQEKNAQEAEIQKLKNKNEDQWERFQAQADFESFNAQLQTQITTL